MYKLVFIITLLLSCYSWGQQVAVHKEIETCHHYSEHYSYENYNKGQYDQKNLIKEKTIDEYERTVVTQGNNITIIEKMKTYDRDGELAFTHNNHYEIKRTYLDENKYKDEIEYSNTLNVGDYTKNSITNEGIKETKVYQVHPGGAEELIQHLASDGTEYSIEENIEYTKLDGTKYKILMSEDKRVSKTDAWRRDTLFEMRVCNSKKLY